MIIRISDIENVVKVQGEIEGRKFEKEDGEDPVRFASPLLYELTVRKKGEVLSIRGPVESTLTLTCGKCLEQYNFHVEAFVDIELAPTKLMPSESELELKGEDLDTYYYEGDEIELDPFVYEEIMLNVPIRPLCKEDCRGLCETCGCNRNTEECRCSGESHTLLGDKLKSFLN
ncbi:MAG TPA: DUF177 domain-containing protein [Syntrophorhabdaceae bacterium]|jgi:uncharacterized protein